MVRAIEPTRRKETVLLPTFKNLVKRPMVRSPMMGQKNSSNSVNTFLLEIIQFLYVDARYLFSSPRKFKENILQVGFSYLYVQDAGSCEELDDSIHVLLRPVHDYLGSAGLSFNLHHSRYMLKLVD